MLVYDSQNVSPVIEPEGGYSGIADEGTDDTRSKCAGGGETARSTRFQRSRAAMKSILKLFGYRERLNNFDKAIHEACMLNTEMNGRLSVLRTKIKADLPGDVTWFKKEKDERDDT